MRLIPVHDEPEAARLLYALLYERPKKAWISHNGMPTEAEHAFFVSGHPFRFWYLIKEQGEYVGAIEATDRNEIGVHVFQKYWRRGYGSRALKLFLDTHEPLMGVKAVRNGNWVANIGVENIDAQLFFRKAGFEPLQVTFAL